jgi:ParB family transcriptional regulator, chromosome partitioning protein
MDNQMSKEIFNIHVDDIIPNRFQPRLTFDENALYELGRSIQQHGIIQPLVLRRVGDKYEIIAGERRYKAACLIGLQTVPGVIMDLDDKRSAELAVVENIQRKDLSPIEEARSYKKLLERGYTTQEQLATRMGKNQGTISNKLRLLNLDDSVQEALLEEKISERHARSLLSLKDPLEQKQILEKIIINKLTVKQTDEMIKSITGEVVQGEISDEMGNDINNNNEADIKQNESQTIVNKLEEYNPQNNIDNIGVVDIERVKQEAVDINAPREMPNLDSLLYNPDVGEKQDNNPATFIGDNNNEGGQEAVHNEERDQTFKFFDSLEDEEATMGMEEPKGEIPPLIDNSPVFNFDGPTGTEQPRGVEHSMDLPPITETPSTVSFPANYGEQAPTAELINNEETSPARELDIKLAISTIREVIGDLDRKGYTLDLEEFDFESLYQMIIKIRKK